MPLGNTQIACLKKWLWIVPEVPLDVHLTALRLAEVVVTVEDDVRLRPGLHRRGHSQVADLDTHYACKQNCG